MLDLPAPVRKNVARCRKVQGNVFPVVFSNRLHSYIEYRDVHRVQLIDGSGYGNVRSNEHNGASERQLLFRILNLQDQRLPRSRS